MRYFAIFTTIIFSLFFNNQTMAVQHAGDTVVYRIPGLGVVEYEQLFVYYSHDGEAVDDFVVRISDSMRSYTDKTGFEACGVLASDSKRLGIIVGTNHSHTACINFKTKVPGNMTATSDTVHTHTTKSWFKANRNDLIVLAGSSKKVGTRVRAGNPDLLSDEDFGAPGFMISTSKIYHHTGSRKTVREVGSVPTQSLVASVN